MRILALDIGKRRIGTALSDALGVTCRPYKTIDRNKEAVQAIADIVRAEEVGKVIAGLPLHLSGMEGTQAKDVRHFVSKLIPALNVPLEFRDERLTTVAAEERLSDRRIDRRKKEDIDAVAAAILLEDYLKEQ